MVLTNQNLIHEHELLFSSEPLHTHLPSRDIKIKIHKTVILCGCETWTLT
jgi:hypothetical protein